MSSCLRSDVVMSPWQWAGTKQAHPSLRTPPTETDPHPPPSWAVVVLGGGGLYETDQTEVRNRWPLQSGQTPTHRLVMADVMSDSWKASGPQIAWADNACDGFHTSPISSYHVRKRCSEMHLSIEGHLHMSKFKHPGTMLVRDAIKEKHAKIYKRSSFITNAYDQKCIEWSSCWCDLLCSSAYRVQETWFYTTEVACSIFSQVASDAFLSYFYLWLTELEKTT